MFEIVDATCLDDNMEALCEQVDVIFTATPQGFLASVLTEDILSKTKIVDLSADFRIKDIATYEKWYKIENKSPQFIEEAVYGLCEINRDKVKGARLVANPGCYTTCSILTAYPLVKEGLIDPDTLIIDAKSGTSGAGRGAKVANLFCEVNENMKAYGVAPQAWGPLAEGKHGIFTDPILTEIGNKYGKTAAQVALKWNEQRGVSIIPKSVHVERMEQNIDIWDFTLTDDEMNKIAEKDLGHSEIVNHDDPAFVKMICGMKIH